MLVYKCCCSACTAIDLTDIQIIVPGGTEWPVAEEIQFIAAGINDSNKVVMLLRSPTSKLIQDYVLANPNNGLHYHPYKIYS